MLDMLFSFFFCALDHNDAILEKNHRSTDSDNEEFCDSMEHLATDERLSTSKGLSQGSGAGSMKQRDVWFESNTTLIDGEDHVLTGDVKEGISPRKHNSSLSRTGRGSQTPRATCSAEPCVSVNTTCCYVSPSRLHPGSVTRGSINEQIATALLRLQRDMANVLYRLHALEELTKSQSRSSLPRREDSVTVPRQFLRPSWWPCDFSPLTVVFTALWPLITHWLVHLYLQRKRSKIPWIVYYYWQLSTSIKEDELWMKTMHFWGVLWLSWAKIRCRVQWGICRNLKGCFRWTNGWKLGNVV